jgi:hypothetical protein
MIVALTSTTRPARRSRRAKRDEQQNREDRLDLMSSDIRMLGVNVNLTATSTGRRTAGR